MESLVHQQAILISLTALALLWEVDQLLVQREGSLLAVLYANIRTLMFTNWNSTMILMWLRYLIPLRSKPCLVLKAPNYLEKGSTLYSETCRRIRILKHSNWILKILVCPCLGPIHVDLTHVFQLSIKLFTEEQLTFCLVSMTLDSHLSKTSGTLIRERIKKLKNKGMLTVMMDLLYLPSRNVPSTISSQK